MIDIVLLGVSALLPLPGRAETAATLSINGRTILFDCGEGTQCAARAAHANAIHADVIALTHYHGDHIFGLPGLLQTMHIMGRAEPLLIVGPRGIHEALAPILTLVGFTAFELRLAEMPEGGLALSAVSPGWPVGARLIAFPTEHRVPSQGYALTLERAGRFLPERARSLGIPQPLWSRLQNGEIVEANGLRYIPEQVLGAPRRGLKFVFSGDTAPCETLVQAAQDADLLICEATYGENEQARDAIDRGHMTFAQAAEIARRAGARRLWLAHFSQMIEDPSACLPNAQAIFPQAECGADGMRITLKFDA